jgi:hypothetical protein
MEAEMPTQDHLYTIQPDEQVAAITNFGYAKDVTPQDRDGIRCYVFGDPRAQGFQAPPGTVPLFRLLGSVGGLPNHIMISDTGEFNNAITQFGYRYEKIACFVLSK